MMKKFPKKVQQSKEESYESENESEILTTMSVEFQRAGWLVGPLSRKENQEV
jgi:hypothetical protein